MTDHLTRIDPNANMRRFYRVDVQPGLFGDSCLIRAWGRIGTHGQSKEQWFEATGDAQSAGAKIIAQKRRRGYGDALGEDAVIEPIG